MFFTKPRFPLLVFGILVAIATTDVAVARADTESGVTPTACGAGNITSCGWKRELDCRLTLKFRYSLIPLHIEWYYEEECDVVGHTEIFKDVPTPRVVRKRTCKGIEGDDGDEFGFEEPFDDTVCFDS